MSCTAALLCSDVGLRSRPSDYRLEAKRTITADGTHSQPDYICVRSTYHGGCLPSALELFCDILLARRQDGDAFSDLQQQAILFVNGVVRNPGYRGKTAAGVTLTPAAREQVQNPAGDGLIFNAVSARGRCPEGPVSASHRSYDRQNLLLCESDVTVVTSQMRG